MSCGINVQTVKFIQMHDYFKTPDQTSLILIYAMLAVTGILTVQIIIVLIGKIKEEHDKRLSLSGPWYDKVTSAARNFKRSSRIKRIILRYRERIVIAIAAGAIITLIICCLILKYR